MKRTAGLALGFGIVTHATFLGAIAVMFVALHGGMTIGLGGFTGTRAWIADLALLLSFPVLHSFLLARPGRALLARLWGKRLGADLVSTSYALVASLQLLCVFLAWSPLGPIWFEPTGLLLWVWRLGFVCAWVFLGKAIFDGGILLQTGALGWLAVLRGRRPDYGPLRMSGLFARCRQPIYLGFALTLWTGPTWTPDHLLIACSWTIYCVLGPLLKEARFLRWHGADFSAYRAKVPYLLPRIFS